MMKIRLLLAAAACGGFTLSARAFERATPESQGVSSRAVLAWVDTAEKVHDFHSFVLVRHGKLIAEGWWAPYAAERPHLLYSLSKSFTSTAVGLAVDEGKLKLDDRVATFFPDKLPAQPSEQLLRMRVRDLLCMATGGRDTIYTMTADMGKDWAQTFLSCPLEKEPGTWFCYNTGATYMLAAIVTKATGEDLVEYLTPRLFQPLGIASPDWSKSPQGIRCGGYGLRLKTRDIAAFGQLYLQKGQWNGRRLLSESWVAQATSKEISNGSDPASDWHQGYGFQFWRCLHNAYRADGAFGQFCIVMPDQDAVMAITAGIGDTQPELNTVWDLLIPAFKSAALPADPAAAAALNSRLASLALKPVEEKCAPSPVAAGALGKTYALAANPQGIRSVALVPAGGGVELVLENAFGSQRLTVGQKVWSRSGIQTLNLQSVPFEKLAFPPGPQSAEASGAWIAPDTYRVKVEFTGIPYRADADFHFRETELALDVVFPFLMGPREFHFKGTAAQ